ncbi:MAG TPA: ABC transporter ATP-binding protein [Gaiellaceae bacterium]|nr:ABC transporter ATP-binding protein [Gaiellaceae bacterium]
MIAAELDRVTKRFGRVAALDAVSFAVSEGEVVALLGPNGAGKTTAIATLLGLRRPDAGAARLFGEDPRRPASRRNVGATPQETTFPGTLRVREVIDLVRAHFERAVPAETLSERFELGRLVHRQLGGLSGGERRRVGVALAFAGAPRLVVLDEPTAGLDRDARHAVWDAIRAHTAAGGALLLTTHQLEEADALAERVVLIDRGAIVADGSIAEVKAGAGLTVVRFRAAADLVLDGAERHGDFVQIRTHDAGAEVEQLVRAGVSLRELEVRPLTLDEALHVRSGAE